MAKRQREQNKNLKDQGRQDHPNHQGLNDPLKGRQRNENNIQFIHHNCFTRQLVRVLCNEHYFLLHYHVCIRQPNLNKI